ncbi:uncharacterized protein LOC128932358 [Callithrix jacchus]
MNNQEALTHWDLWQGFIHHGVPDRREMIISLVHYIDAIVPTGSDVQEGERTLLAPVRSSALHSCLRHWGPEKVMTATICLTYTHHLTYDLQHHVQTLLWLNGFPDPPPSNSVLKF